MAKLSEGVLPIPLSVTQKASSPAKNKSKTAASRLKLLIRRLPPGLTQAEFETQLGDEWKLGSGRVDWSLFKNGRISKE
jgi:regulator of nonsense transcripts 3